LNLCNLLLVNTIVPFHEPWSFHFLLVFKLFPIILNFQRWKLAPSNFSMTFKDSIWKEDILNTKTTTNTLSNLKVEVFNNSKNSHLNTFTLILLFFRKRKSFPHLKTLQHFEEMSSTPPTHLERLLLSLQPCKLKAFPQKDSPFLCCTRKTFDYLLF